MLAALGVRCRRLPAARWSAPLAPDGAWCWFQDPRAVYDDGRTYTGYVTAAGDIGGRLLRPPANELRRFDHRPRLPARRPRGARAARPAGRPADGDLVGPPRAGRCTSAHDKRPGDVFGWGNTRVLGTNAPGYDTYTYANPVKVGRRLFVFWRAEAGASAAGQAAYSFSDDDGDTWQPGQVLLSERGAAALRRSTPRAATRSTSPTPRVTPTRRRPASATRRSATGGCTAPTARRSARRRWPP